jgi:transcriptional regulator with XRE-family HTH domain
MQYTLRGLYDKLGITLAELSRRSGISDVTLASIRDGKSARRSTINTLLHTFSDIYGIELSTDNVSGIIIKDKLARLESAENEPRITKKAIEPPILTPVQSAKVANDKASKRVYKRKQNTGLPNGCILATEFAASHGVPRETFRDHMNWGLGPGLVHGPDVPEDGSILVKDWVRYEERNKRVRKDGTIEKERYLTPEQQAAAIEFWKRHGVPFTMPEA